jgi:hypothetical protein
MLDLAARAVGGPLGRVVQMARESAPPAPLQDGPQEAAAVAAEERAEAAAPAPLLFPDPAVRITYAQHTVCIIPCTNFYYVLYVILYY